MTPVRIPLEPPVVIGTKRYDCVKVKPPSYHDFMDIGEALTFQHDGTVQMTVEHIDRMKAYAERCVTTGDDAIAEPAVLAAGGFRLARQVQEALIGFLYYLRDGTGTTSPTSSSSA